MKVAIISSVHRWDDTRVFIRQASSLTEKYTVELHAQAPFNVRTKNKVRVIGLSQCKGKITRIKLWWVLLLRMLKTDASIVHFHDPELLPFALIIKIVTGKKIIYDVHEHIVNDIEDKEWIPRRFRSSVSFLFQILERICVPCFDTVIYTTPLVGERYHQISKKNVSIENYPPIRMFREPKKNTPKEQRTDIVYVGRVFYVRGVEEIIRSWPKVLASYPNARFLIVGDIVPQSYAKRLKQVAKELDMDGKVLFCGFVEYAHIGAYLKNASAGIVTFLPYKNNMSCLPNKLFEYMASSIPVIASDFELYKEVVEGAGCGLIVDPTNTDQVADAVVQLLDNKEDALKMGRNGRSAVLDKYCWEKEEHKLFDLYKNLE
jgi:glycosyltransferase involved in cell wall biosynthesis